jgi:hypothetical protein
VRDTGYDMAPSVAARAIEPFFTTKKAGKGTGLGLAMVHGFAEQSGGCLLIDTRVGVGTTVEIVLPRADQEAARESEPDEAPELDLALHGGAMVLVVEADDQMRQATAAMLRDLRYTVVEARNAEEAAYRRCVRDRQPVYQFIRFDFGDGSPTRFERLLLPLAEGGQEITHRLGVILFDEVSS